MDERTGDDGRATRNGVGAAGGSRWHTPISDALRAYPRRPAETSPEQPEQSPEPPPEFSPERSAPRPSGRSPEYSPAPVARAAVRTDGGDATPPAPGLDDPTPPGGVPLAEPPLWREAVRFAPTSPAPYPWDGAPPAPEGGARPEDVATSAPPGPAPSAGAPPAPPTAGHPPEPATAPGDPAPTGGTRGRGGELPQRVPAEPDVPDLGEPATVTPPAETPELARIATRLRHDDVPGSAPADGFDVDEVLAAVRAVPGVQAAALRASHTGAHTLRLDLSEDADPVHVSRVVARMLQERMGLSAAPQYVPAARPAPEGRGAIGSAAVPSSAPPAAPGPDTPPDAAAAAGTAEQPPGAAEPATGAAQEPEHWSPPTATAHGPRVVIDNVQVNVVGTHATVQVQLAAGGRRAVGLARGPAIDSYVVRLAAVSAAKAIDQLMDTAARPDRPSRCFVEHTGVVPFGSTEVAVVVVMLVCGAWVEQLAGSAVVDGDARHAAVRATLGAVNRRLDALLAG